MVDQACTMCANDNVELACAIVQKTATEKAIIEVDKYLKNVRSIIFLILKNILFYLLYSIILYLLLFLKII